MIPVFVLLFCTLLTAAPLPAATAPDLRAQAEQTLRQTLQLQDRDLVEIDRVPPLVIPVDGHVEMTLKPGQPKRGHLRLEGGLYQGEKRLSRFEIDAKVTLIRTVYLLKNEKRRAEPIHPEELTPVLRDVTYDSDLLYDPVQLAGIEAVGMIPAGVALSAKNTRPIPDVRRGETVRVSLENGRVNLEYQAEAREDGVIGDIIVCRNPGSGRTFNARITGKNRVIVDMETK